MPYTYLVLMVLFAGFDRWFSVVHRLLGRCTLAAKTEPYSANTNPTEREPLFHPEINFLPNMRLLNNTAVFRIVVGLKRKSMFTVQSILGQYTAARCVHVRLACAAFIQAAQR